MNTKISIVIICLAVIVGGGVWCFRSASTHSLTTAEIADTTSSEIMAFDPTSALNEIDNTTDVSAESFAHFQELIDQFNLEHGTEYRIEFDEVLESEGRNRSELLSFYQSMTDEEFFQ